MAPRLWFIRCWIESLFWIAGLESEKKRGRRDQTKSRNHRFTTFFQSAIVAFIGTLSNFRSIVCSNKWAVIKIIVKFYLNTEEFFLRSFTDQAGSWKQVNQQNILDLWHDITKFLFCIMVASLSSAWVMIFGSIGLALLLSTAAESCPILSRIPLCKADEIMARTKDSNGCDQFECLPCPLPR